MNNGGIVRSVWVKGLAAGLILAGVWGVVLIVRRMILPAQAFHSALLLHPVYLFGLA